MKKIFFYIVTVALLSISVPSQAMEMSVGANVWYAKWDMNDGGTEVDPGLLYGPALSIKLSDSFGFNTVFLMGDFEAGSESYRRYDSDTSGSYKLNDYFKIFAGLKYMAYRINMEFSDEFPYTDPITGVTSYDEYSSEVSIDVDSFGPAAGISVVFPLGNSFFVIGNISGMYLWTTFKEDVEGGNSSTLKEKTYGANATGAIAYYIAPASVTVSLSGRYQYINYYEDQMDSQHDIYGVTASVIYSFSL